MQDRVEQLIHRLTAELRTWYPQMPLTNLSVVGQGLESLVCRANSTEWGPVAIRIPWERLASNENDTAVDNRVLLEQEAAMMNHLKGQGLPVPEAYRLHTHGSLDFLVSSFVPNDSGPVKPHQLGELAAAIHACPLPPGIIPYGQGDRSLSHVIAERVQRRLEVVEKHTGMSLPLPAGWEKPLRWQGGQSRILHMDFRPANILAHHGSIAAIIDWSNMLFGDPALELARIAEYGLLDDGFLAGYGNQDCFGHLPPGLETLYRLDTAVMLAVVFLSEAPNTEMAEPQVERVRHLLNELETALAPAPDVGVMASPRTTGGPWQVRVGRIEPALAEPWNACIRRFGTPFQTAEFMRLFEAHWSGRFVARHIAMMERDRVVAAIPAYLYDSCPRVDYYRFSCPEIAMTDPLLVSHAFVVWGGFPVLSDPALTEPAARIFAETAAQQNAVAMFSGIDGRDQQGVEFLKRSGFAVGQIHTNMERDLTAVSAEDPTQTLIQKHRNNIRNQLSQARRAGVSVRLATERDYPEILNMVADVVTDHNAPADILPTAFVQALLETPLPGIQALVAVDPQDQPIGVHLGLCLGSTYFTWIGGHHRETLTKYHQSHMLYIGSIKRAIELGCSRIQAGRVPFDIKIRHGFRPVPLLCAVKGSNPEQHDRAARWVSALEKRHWQKYGHFFSNPLYQFRQSLSPNP